MLKVRRVEVPPTLVDVAVNHAQSSPTSDCAVTPDIRLARWRHVWGGNRGARPVRRRAKGVDENPPTGILRG